MLSWVRQLVRPGEDHLTDRGVLGAQAFFGLALLTIAEWPDVRPFAGATAELMRPPPGGPEFMVRFFPFGELAANAFHIFGVLAVSAFALGRRRAAAFLVTAWAIAAWSVVFSAGKIGHTYIPWFVPLLAWVIGGRVVKGQFSLSRVPVSVALSAAWVTAAAPKLLGGWLDLDTRSVATVVAEFDYSPFTSALLQLPAFALEAFDWLVVGGEFLLAVMFLIPRMRRVATLAAVAFHIGVVAMLGITYEPVLPIYMFLLLDQQQYVRVQETFNDTTRRRAALCAIVCLAATWRLLSDAPNAIQWSANADVRSLSSSLFFVAFGLAVWLRIPKPAMVIDLRDRADDLTVAHDATVPIARQPNREPTTTHAGGHPRTPNHPQSAQADDF